MGKVLKLWKGINTITHFHGASNPKVKVRVQTDNYYNILPGEKLANVSLTACGGGNALSFEGLNDLNINKQLFLPVSYLKNMQYCLS